MIGDKIGALMRRFDFNTCREWEISCDWQEVYRVTLRGESGELTMTDQRHMLDTLLENALDTWERQHPRKE